MVSSSITLGRLPGVRFATSEKFIGSIGIIVSAVGLDVGDCSSTSVQGCSSVLLLELS